MNRSYSPSRRRPGGLLWQRNFRLLWTGETISEVGNALAVVGIPLLAVTVLRASTFVVAALTAAAYLPWLVIGLPAGAWVDRLPARPLMITCDLISAVLYASLPAAAWMNVLTTGQVVVVALLAGVVNVMFTTAYQTYLPALVTEADMVEGNAKLQGSAAAAQIGGTSTAGLAAEAVGAAASLLFNAASFMVSAVCLLRIRTETAPRRPAVRTTTVRTEIAEGIRFVARDPYLRPLSIYAAVSNLGYAGCTALVVLFLVRVVGLSSTVVGLLMATVGAGAVLGASTVAWTARRLGTARALLLNTLGTGLFGLLIPLTGTGARTLYCAVGLLLLGAGVGSANVLVGSFRQTYCPPEMLGRVTASMRFAVFGIIPLGALLAGGLGTILGLRSALWVVLPACVLSGTLLLTGDIRTDKDLPTAKRILGPDHPDTPASQDKLDQARYRAS